jgi:hypothetical protein
MARSGLANRRRRLDALVPQSRPARSIVRHGIRPLHHCPSVGTAYVFGQATSTRYATCTSMLELWETSHAHQPTALARSTVLLLPRPLHSSYTALSYRTGFLVWRPPGPFWWRRLHQVAAGAECWPKRTPFDAHLQTGLSSARGSAFFTACLAARGGHLRPLRAHEHNEESRLCRKRPQAIFTQPPALHSTGVLRGECKAAERPGASGGAP